MKDALSSLELHYLAQELQGFVGARLDKAYQGGGVRKDDLALQFHKSGEGKKLLRIILPGIAYSPGEKPVYGKMPGHFAIFLRRRLGNARLVRVEQRGFERILELSFENKNGLSTLIIELLPPGNMLLLNGEEKILGLLQPQRHGQRLLRGGAQYEPPPSVFNTRTASEAELLAHLAKSNKDSVVKALASDLGLGSRYAEEACARADIPKDSEPTKQGFNELVPVVKSLFVQEPAPNTSVGEAFPFSLATLPPEQVFSSFSAAIESIAPKVVGESDPERTAKNPKRPLVEIQRAQLEAYKKAALENQRKGELLYEHYQEVQSLLDSIMEDRKNLSWPAIKEKYKERSGIVEIDETKGEVTVLLGDDVGGGGREGVVNEDGAR